MADARNPIRLGIVGCGRATRVHHLPALTGMPDFEIVAVADPDAARRDEIARRLPRARAFPSHRELLEKTDLDAVAVVSPTTTHVEIGLDVLRAGRHLFMEKPLAVTIEDCDRLIQNAAGSPAKIVVAHNSRWHRLVARARQLLRGGLLGPVRAVRSVYTHAHLGPNIPEWHKYRALGGGVLINDGVHHFDLWRYLLDTRVIQVRADSIDSAYFEDDTCTVSARLASGALASAVLSFATSPNSELEFFGEAGSLLVSLYRFDGLVFTPCAELPGSIGGRLRHAAGFARSFPVALSGLRHGGDFAATYRALWRHFAACILRDETPTCGLSDGRASVAVAQACVESASSGRAVCWE